MCYSVLECTFLQRIIWYTVIIVYNWNEIYFIQCVSLFEKVTWMRSLLPLLIKYFIWIFSFFCVFQKSPHTEAFFNEQPLLKRYVHKIQSINKSTNMFKTAVDARISKIQDVCNNACQRLKIPPRSRFLRQIGSRHINLKNECLNWKEVNAVISTMVVRNFF